MRRQVRNLVWGAMICAMAFGCGEPADETSPGDAGTPDADSQDVAVEEAGGEDGGVDGGEDVEQPDAAGFPITVFEVVNSDVAGPLEGATVAVDLPDGTRQELDTDAEGQVWIQGAWGSDDKITAIAYKSGYSVGSWEGPAAETLPDKSTTSTLLLFTTSSVPRVVVSGKVFGRVDKLNHVNVQETSTSGISEGTEGSYSVYVAAGKPFSLSAFEWDGCPRSCTRCLCQTFFGWTRVDHDAVNENTVVDLDLGDSLEPVFTTGTVTLPEREDSIFRTDAFLNVFVSSLSAPINFGYSLTTDLSDDESTYTYTAEHVVWEDAEDVFTTYRNRYENPISYITVPGYPKKGSLEMEFLDEPEMISPASKDEAVSVLDTFEWVPRETTDARLMVYRNGKVAWMATVASGSSIRLPELPSNADPEEVLGSVPLPAYLVLMSDADGSSKYYQRSLTMEGFRVAP